jgi:hypothetical protein
VSPVAVGEVPGGPDGDRRGGWQGPDDYRDVKVVEEWAGTRVVAK